METSVSEFIRADHREMERLFGELKDPAKRRLVAPAVVALLAAHSRAEESEVYPAVRHETDAVDEVTHSQEEHARADQLAARLVNTPLDEAIFEATLKDLVDAVSHHIGEEEEQVLPALDGLSTDRQQRLGHRFLAVRAAHLCAGVVDLSRAELKQQAENEGIAGASSMNKADLKEEVTAE